MLTQSNILSRHKGAFLRLFRRLNELKAAPVEKRPLALEIQEEILRRISQAERLIQRTKADSKAAKRQLGQRGNDREAARRLKAAFAAGEARLERQREVLSVLRAVGDGIAFIYAERWDLKNLAFHQDAGFITGKSGALLERKLLRALYAKGQTAVLNDLTHTLRHGDITVFRSDRTFIMVEVKSGQGGQARHRRQQEAVERIGNYFVTDERPGDKGGISRRVAVQEDVTCHGGAIGRMILSLPPSGWLLEEVEPGLFYAVLGSEEFEPSSLDDIGRALGREPGQLYAFLANPMKSERAGYFPFTLSIPEPEALFRFYNGECVLVVFVDLERANRSLAPHGFAIEVDGKHDILRVRSIAPETTLHGGEIFVGGYMLGRFASEFIGLEWFLNNVVRGNLTEEMRKHFGEQARDGDDSAIVKVTSPVVD